MKRIIAGLLSIIIVLSLTSCGNVNKSDLESQDNKTESSIGSNNDSANTSNHSKYLVQRKAYTYNIMDSLLFPSLGSRFYEISPSIWVINDNNQVSNCTSKSMGSPYRIKHYYTYNQKGCVEKVLSEIQDSNNSTVEWNLDYEYDQNSLPLSITVTITGPQLYRQNEGDKQYISYSYNEYQKPSEISVCYEEEGTTIKTKYITLSYNENQDLDEAIWYYDNNQEYIETIKYIYDDNSNLKETQYNRSQSNYPNDNYWTLSYDNNGNIINFTSPPAEKSSGSFEYDNNGNLSHYYMNYFVIGEKYNTDERSFNNNNINVDENGNLINEDSLDY